MNNQLTQTIEFLQNILSNTGEFLRFIKYALYVLIASLVLIAVLGTLNVLDSVPLLGNVLDLIAIYYIYNDRDRVARLIKAAVGTVFVSDRTSLESPETESSADTQI